MMLAAILCALAGLTGAQDQVEVNLDRDRISVVRGETFTARSTITNRGTRPTTPLKVHLNVASLTGAVSVDPSDWSPSPIQNLPPLAPGESISTSWEIKVGDIGSFAMYLVLLPPEPHGTSVSSPPVFVDAAGQNPLDPNAALPFLLAIPVLLGSAAGLARWHFRRSPR